MNWKEFILKELNQPDRSTTYRLANPVHSDLLVELKTQLGLLELPAELEEFYLQSNGIEEMLGEEKIGELIWNIERVVDTNKQYRTYPPFREIYRSFDQVLFFSDAGNGDLFAFVSHNGNFMSSDVFVWSHENDSRTRVADNLTKFLQGWTNGIIKI